MENLRKLRGIAGASRTDQSPVNPSPEVEKYMVHREPPTPDQSGGPSFDITASLEERTGRLVSQHGLGEGPLSSDQTEITVQRLEDDVAQKRQKLADSQHKVAVAYRANGQMDEAVRLLEHVVAEREALGENNLRRLVSKHELAVTYRVSGQVNKAVPLLEEVVALRNTSNEHDETKLASQHELAVAYRISGQVNKAVKLLEEVVAIQETLPQDHSHRLASQQELASAYRVAGRVDKAVEMMEHVAAIKQRTLGEGRLDTLVSQHDLAVAYRASGQVEKAIQLLEHVAAAKETLPKSHPHRLATQHELASAYRAFGEVGKAVEILKEVANIQGTLPQDHPHRLATEHELASAYRAHDQVDEALQLLEKVASIQEALPVDHPHRLATQHELASTYRAAGRLHEAISLFESVVEIKEKVLAEDNLSRLASQHELANAYRDCGRLNDAIKLLEYIVNIKELTLREYDPERLSCQVELASVYRLSGRTQEAEKLLAHAKAVGKRTLSGEDSDQLAPQSKPLAVAVSHMMLDNEAAQLRSYADALKDEVSSEKWLSRTASPHEPATALTSVVKEIPFGHAESYGCAEANDSTSPSTISDTSSDTTDSPMEQRKSAILNHVTIYFTNKLQLFFSLQHRTAQNSDNEPKSTHSSSRNLNSSSSENRVGSRRRKREGSDSDMDDGMSDTPSDTERDSDKGKKGKEVERPKFACPYFKYNPAKYKSSPLCPGPGWSDIHRVKEHLYRRHRQPKHRCGRCQQSFDDEQIYLDHQRSSDPCLLREIEPVEGFDSNQEKRLRSRKRAKPDSDEAQKWKAIFSILFPHVVENSIPSPYYEYDYLQNVETGSLGSLARCEEYILREVPLRLRQELRPVLDRDLNMVEDNLRQIANERIRDILKDVFREFRNIQQTNNPATLSAGAVPSQGPGLETATETATELQKERPEETSGDTGWDELSFLEARSLDFTMTFDEELLFGTNFLLENLPIVEEQVEMNTGHDPYTPCHEKSSRSSK